MRGLKIGDIYLHQGKLVTITGFSPEVTYKFDNDTLKSEPLVSVRPLKREEYVGEGWWVILDRFISEAKPITKNKLLGVLFE